MKRKAVFTKVLAAAGTFLACFPFLFMILTSVVRTIQTRILLFDWLIPAELFPVELVGALLLFWAALRVHAYQKAVGFGFLAAFFFLLGGQGIAVMSGLASGETGTSGIAWILVIASVVLYSLCLIELCITGALLLRKLFQK